MYGFTNFMSRFKLLLIFNVFALKNAFADFGYECYSFECTGIEYCCGYHYCCVDYAQIWYVWVLLVLFIVFIISAITCCCVRRRREGVVIRGAVVTQNPGTTYTATTIHAPEQQQPIFYGNAPPTYGAAGGYQQPYQPQHYDPYAGAPPAYQAKETKAPSAPQYQP